MKTFKVINFKRDYETTNIKFIQSETNPNPKIFVECDSNEINCEQLYIQAGVRYFGFL